MTDIDGNRRGWKKRIKSWWYRQHNWGHFSMRKGRPAIHWRDGRSKRPHRIEWDKKNKWHYNPARGGHKKVRHGFKAYGKYAGRAAGRAAWRLSWIGLGYQSWRRSYDKYWNPNRPGNWA